MKKFLLAIMATFLLVLIVGCSDQEEASSESSSEEGTAEEASKDQTINFGVTPWTSTVPPTKVAELLLEDMGYSVKETKSNVGGVFMGLSRGDLDVFMDPLVPDQQSAHG